MKVLSELEILIGIVYKDLWPVYINVSVINNNKIVIISGDYHSISAKYKDNCI